MNHLALSLVLLGLSATVGCSRTDDPAPAQITTAISTRTVVFDIQGMHCDGCANAIATKAGRVEGVVTCEASFEDGTAVVEVAPDSVDDVQAAIASLGYTIAPAGE